MGELTMRFSAEMFIRVVIPRLIVAVIRSLILGEHTL